MPPAEAAMPGRKPGPASTSSELLLSIGTRCGAIWLLLLLLLLLLLWWWRLWRTKLLLASELRRSTRHAWGLGLARRFFAAGVRMAELHAPLSQLLLVQAP